MRDGGEPRAPSYVTASPLLSGSAQRWNFPHTYKKHDLKITHQQTRCIQLLSFCRAWKSVVQEPVLVQPAGPRDAGGSPLALRPPGAPWLLFKQRGGAEPPEQRGDACPGESGGAVPGAWARSSARSANTSPRSAPCVLGDGACVVTARCLWPSLLVSRCHWGESAPKRALPLSPPALLSCPAFPAPENDAVCVTGSRFKPCRRVRRWDPCSRMVPCGDTERRGQPWPDCST